jgi:mRNA interferase MazF
MVPRPALVLTPRPVGPDGLLLWAVMITNAARSSWPGDVPIVDAERLGLLIPSKIRTAKIVAAETASASRIGRLDEETLGTVLRLVRSYLDFD